MFFKKDNVPKLAENVEKEASDSAEVKENPLTIDEEQTDTKIVEELEKIDSGEEAETATILSENEQTSVPTVSSIGLGFDIKKEEISTEERAPIATNSHEDLVISEEEKISLYSLIFKFGFLSYDQISKMFSDEIAQKTIQQSKLDNHKIAKDTLFFHNAETIKELAHLSQDNVKELKKEALFWKQMCLFGKRAWN